MPRMQPSCPASVQRTLRVLGVVWVCVLGGGIGVHHHRVQPWLERLKIAHLAHRQVGTLSGGEAQRTSLARALVLDPEILFLDEPFAALDAPTRTRLVGELADILAERRIAALFVTHDLAEASDLSHRCVVLDQGRVLQDKPCHHFLYSGGAFARLYPEKSSPTRNHATKTKR